MNNNRITATFICMLLGLACMAQTKKVGDYIETFSNAEKNGMVPRQIQYYPDGTDFVCVNGKNRFTRALYGSNTDYRIETSDRPVFALYQSKNYRSLRFLINGVQLDESDYCEARYGKGRRSYVVRDARWGASATLRVECVAMHEKEGGYWHFVAEGFGDTSVTLKMMVCQIANPKLRRNGDIGADKPGCFEPSPVNEGLITSELTFKGEAIAVTVPAETKTDGHIVTLHQVDEVLKKSFAASRAYFETLSERVSFMTPDPLFNTLGSVLTLAADGAWDGQTWLHGAIGWRMPLAGWRAGYLGDVLGWNDRAVSHFDAYARSQVTNVPAVIDSPSQDKEQNMARAEKRWGTQMYSNGYICRNPNRNDQMHHYDMNLNYIDELLWHFEYDADTAYMRKMWPVLQSHLSWEKRNFDKDGSHLYDAYCCIWASDALYYNGGEVTHSSAYNYRGNLLAAKIARIIGEDPTPYQQEADAIRRAMDEQLWYDGHWAEYKDNMGLRRLHPDAALWSVYTPIDCGVGTDRQRYECTRYVDQHIPHIPVEVASTPGKAVPQWASDQYYVVSTSDWMPYSWSINNVASAEIMHTALAFFEAGRSAEGMNLVKGNIMDQMYLGASPGNLGQISYYDAARGESYRDFGDNIGISSRAIVQGVFGIVPQALDGQCIIRPGFPLSWDSVEVKTPYLTYKYKRVGEKASLSVTQHFTRPLRIVVRMNGVDGAYTDYVGTDAETQVIDVMIPAQTDHVVYEKKDRETPVPMECNEAPEVKKVVPVQMTYNANVTDIFRNQYLSPRPASTSLEIPVQGIGEWCHPKYVVEISDSAFRSRAKGDKTVVDGITYITPQSGHNILYASLWDNYPDSVSVDIKKPQKAQCASLLLTGSTNHMQYGVENAVLVAEYADGTETLLPLVPPYNYCPIEQDYYLDGKAFSMPTPRPLRVSFSSGMESRNLGHDMGVSDTEVYGRELDGGAAQVVYMRLDGSKKVKRIRLRCLSNDIVVGIMAVTLMTTAP